MKIRIKLLVLVNTIILVLLVNSQYGIADELNLSRDIISVKPSAMLCSISNEENTHKGLGYYGRIGYESRMGIIHIFPNIGYGKIKAEISENDYILKHYLSFGIDFVVSNTIFGSYIGLGFAEYMPIQENKIDYKNPDFFITINIGLQKEIGISNVFLIPEIRFSYSLSQHSILNTDYNIFLVELSFGIGYALTGY